MTFRRPLVRRLLPLAAAAAAACGLDPTGPGAARVTGVYLHVGTDGVAREVNGFGVLSITAAFADYRPDYVWSVEDDSGRLVASDDGNWSARGGRVEFRSRQRAAAYESPVARAPDGAPVLDVTAADGRRYTFRRVRAPGAPSGYLRVAVADGATGAQVGGALFHITSGEGLRQRAGSTDDAPYMTAGGPGEWTVLLVEPPRGYALAPGEANPRRVTVAAGQDRTADVRFTVVRAAP